MNKILFAGLLSSMFMLSSCMSIPQNSIDHMAANVVLLEIEFANLNGGHCSGTIVSDRAILTATHCFHAQIKDIKIVGQSGQYDVQPIKIVDDGADHALVIFPEKTFKRWARMEVRDLEMGEDIKILGNPGVLRSMYRKGYVSGVDNTNTDMPSYLVDFPGFGGDSGSGVFDDRGRVVGVVSYVRIQVRSSNNNLQLFQMPGLIKFQFKDEQWQEAGIKV